MPETLQTRERDIVEMKTRLWVLIPALVVFVPAVYGSIFAAASETRVLCASIVGYIAGRTAGTRW